MVASSSYDMDEAEVREIIEVISADTFKVNGTFTFFHYSEIETYGDFNFPMKCEVALLSRNVKIRGADIDSIGTNYGAHIMMMGQEILGL